MKIKGSDGQETPKTNQGDESGPSNPDDDPGTSMEGVERKMSKGSEKLDGLLSKTGNAHTSLSGQQNVQQQMSSGLDKLDSLLAKTENAQYAMAHQSKQMKSFLK